MIEQGDILLVPFPFSDQSGTKARSVVVISNNEFNEYSEDTLVIGMASNISKGKHTINLTNDDLEEGILSTVCCIKVENILKIENELVIKKIGKIKPSVLANISKKLFEIIREDQSDNILKKIKKKIIELR